MRVKIELQKGETQEYAEDLLLKALKSKRKIKQKSSHAEKFENKGIQVVEKEMLSLHKKIYSELIEDIINIIGK